MKKTKLIASLAIVLAASVASAADSYLYWMVNNANYNNSVVNFDYATISTDGGSSYLSLYSSGASGSVTQYLWSDGYNSSYGAPSSGIYAGFSGTPTSFLVELWNASDTRVGWQSYSYSELAQHLYNSTTGGGLTTPFGVSQVVPEPTSGLLMLIGMAGLALKRKRA